MQANRRDIEKEGVGSERGMFGSPKITEAVPMPDIVVSGKIDDKGSYSGLTD